MSSSGVDALHLLEEAVRPALMSLGPGYHSVSAEQLVMGTAAVESHLIWLRQHGKGPALGFWQMEPFTFDDLMKRCSQNTYDRIIRLSATGWMDDENRAYDYRRPPEPSEMTWNLRFAAAMCRLKYRDDPFPLPPPGDVFKMAKLWKFRYNSVLGAGRIEDYEKAWACIIAPRYKEMWPNA